MAAGTTLSGGSGDAPLANGRRGAPLMQGELEHTALPDLLQFLEGMRTRGHLLIERRDPRQAGGIYLAGGQVVHAYCPPDEGEAALFSLLRWRHGRFIVLAGAAPEQQTIDQDLRSLLLEGARMVDEESRNNLPIVLIDPPPCRLRDPAEAGDVLLTWREWQVLSLVDGERDPGAIAAAATLPEDAVRRALAELAAHGLVVRGLAARGLAARSG